MNFLEFQAGIEKVRSAIVGSQLQDFWVQGKDLLLLFYAGKSRVLRVSLRTPPVLFFESESFKLERNKEKIPLALFLAKHFLRKKICDVKYETDWGRRFEIHFSDEPSRPLWMEIVLVPGFQNVGLFAHEDRKEKKVFWNKPRELPAQANEQKTEVSDFRALETIRDEWYSQWANDSASSVNEKPAQNWQLEVKKKIHKKTEAIEKIKQQSHENEALVARLYEVGERLKYLTVMELPVADQEWLNKIAKNMDRETIFKKAKVLAAKSGGIQERIQILLDEISTLSKTLDGPPPESKHKISIAGKAEVSTRKLEVDKNIDLYMGKNAKDNVQLLKSSQPWELWFHLKDYPSAYAITRKNKSTTIEHHHLKKMATWFAKECFKSHMEKSPNYIDVIYTECRFVKLLKSDKLGRVTYTNEKNLRVPLS